MIRLTWRQFRAQAFVGAGALAVIAVILAVTGPHLVHLYDTTVANCTAQGDCTVATNFLLGQDHLLQQVSLVVVAMPAIIGIFWGAPLVARELETGTFRLAWTQSISRSKWLALKLAIVGFASMVVAGLLSLMVTWWSSPFDVVNLNRFSLATFGERGIVPIGYAAFAFAVGVTAGLLIRRTLPAMVVTIVAFVGARLAVAFWVRPRLEAPVRLSSAHQLPTGNGPVPLGAGILKPNDWVISDQTLNAAGHVIGQNGGIGPNGNIGFSFGQNGIVTFQGVGVCPNKFPAPTVGGRAGGPTSSAVSRATQQCLAHFHLRELLRYQPASRYWPFQWYEAAVFVGLGLVLAGVCFWWIRRRLA
jgi:hypothetical protein